ncbi:hypothetical protein BDW68DRAFT_171959 [Aspergillus falconensis]
MGPFPGYSMEARLVVVAYLEDRSALDEALSARSVLAASFIAGLFREILERDDLCRLGVAFAFYGSCAGLILVRRPESTVCRRWWVRNPDAQGVSAHAVEAMGLNDR